MVVHVVIAVVALGSLSGVRVAAQASDDDGDAIQVMLAGRSGAPATASSASADPMSEVMRRVAPDGPSALRPVSLSAANDRQPTTSLDRLIGVIEDQASPDRVGDNGQGDASGMGDRDADRKSRKVSGKAASSAGDAAGAGSLWAQIEACWRKLPGPASVPVSLQVTLNPNGVLDVPPRIVRSPTSAVSRQALAAEAKALAAVASCGPFKESSTVRWRQATPIEFPAIK